MARPASRTVTRVHGRVGYKQRVRNALRLLVIAWLAACGSSDDERRTCDRYLSCVLATTPEAYAAALSTYGDSSPCWTSSENTDSCSQACAASLMAIGPACRCDTEDSCVAVDTEFSLAAGMYAVSEYAETENTCNLTGWGNDATFTLRETVGADQPIMRLAVPSVLGGLELFGRIADTTGQIEGYVDVGFEHQGMAANVRLTADDRFVATFSYYYSQDDQPSGCDAVFSAVLTRR
jgi:hypothetical protein